MDPQAELFVPQPKPVSHDEIVNVFVKQLQHVKNVKSCLDWNKCTDWVALFGEIFIDKTSYFDYNEDPVKKLEELASELLMSVKTITVVYTNGKNKLRFMHLSLLEFVQYFGFITGCSYDLLINSWQHNAGYTLNVHSVQFNDGSHYKLEYDYEYMSSSFKRIRHINQTFDNLTDLVLCYNLGNLYSGVWQIYSYGLEMVAIHSESGCKVTKKLDPDQYHMFDLDVCYKIMINKMSEIIDDMILEIKQDFKLW